MNGNDTLGAMERCLVNAVAYIIDTRRERRRPPYMALDANIRNVVSQAVDAALKSLVAKGVLAKHTTLNADAYEFTDNT